MSESRYDLAIKAQADAGLRILSTNHMTPPWAGKVDRFPEDSLRI
jgi:hypothetical protein